MTLKQPTPEQLERALIIGEFSHVINSHSLENESGTPDYVLGAYLYDCLTAYNRASRDRAMHRGELKTDAPAEYVSKGDCDGGSN